MTLDPYGDAVLVTLYESDNPSGRDHEFYRALVGELQAKTIIDLGCGTGLLTRSLVAPGRTVIGVDPSATMLDFARRQPGADAVRWVKGDAAAIRQRGDADLVVCTGNAVQHISTEELPAALTHIAGALRPGGVVSFESRNPSFREWQRWTPQATAGERQTPFGHLREWLEVTEVDQERRVVFDAHNIIDGGPDRVFTSVLYFRTGQEFAQHLATTGFTQIEVAVDWGHGQSPRCHLSSSCAQFAAERCPTARHRSPLGDRLGHGPTSCGHLRHSTPGPRRRPRADHGGETGDSEAEGRSMVSCV